MARSQIWQVDVGSLQKALVPHHVDIFWRRLSVFATWQLVFPRVGAPRQREKRKSLNMVSILLLDVSTPSLPPSSICRNNKSGPHSREKKLGSTSWREEDQTICGHILKNHRNYISPFLPITLLCLSLCHSWYISKEATKWSWEYGLWDQTVLIQIPIVQLIGNKSLDKINQRQDFSVPQFLHL